MKIQILTTGGRIPFVGKEGGDVGRFGGERFDGKRKVLEKFVEIIGAFIVEQDSDYDRCVGIWERQSG